MAIFCASGARVLKYAALRIPMRTIAGMTRSMW